VNTLTNVEVDDEIMRLSAVMEEATDESARVSDAAGEAEAEYKLAHAKQLLCVEGKNQGQRDAQALMNCQAEFLRWKLAEGRLRAQAELLRTLRARIDALRTLAANLRSQT